MVVSDDMTRILSPGDDEIGWLAQQGLIPLGYLGDPEKTARTFPVIEGIRHSVPGDRARWDADGESSCSAAIRSPSTPAGRRSLPRRSRPRLPSTPLYTTSW
ncbi:hypothetical protein NIIDMKKI_45590 [Mycobacterium kansasii]|uniref:Uncharacterized protein n=1 Tax=Mycobacterium kansasii TaxID=1768 RepID=A0A7G1IGR3_MYCKA|nr:hypothetical protein NIIDMKKI_45590 [Mycobacterium kansasii]